MGITILGNVGKIIEDNHGEMYFDNAKKIVGTEPKQQREIEDIIPVEEETHQSVLKTDTDNEKILDLLFRADDDDRERTEILLSALLKGKKVKTKIVEELYEHRRYFNLENLTLEDKTKVMNAWIEKLGYTEQLNGKKFTIKDW